MSNCSKKLLDRLEFCRAVFSKQLFHIGVWTFAPFCVASLSHHTLCMRNLVIFPACDLQILIFLEVNSTIYTNNQDIVYTHTGCNARRTGVTSQVYSVQNWIIICKSLRWLDSRALSLSDHSRCLQTQLNQVRSAWYVTAWCNCQIALMSCQRGLAVCYKPHVDDH